MKGEGKTFGFQDGTKVANGEYKPGCFTYAEIKKGSSVYMRRWYLLYFPRLFSVRVHHIRRPDLDRFPHDHPWHFVSIILRGGYMEQWCKADDFQAVGRRWIKFNRRRVNRFSFHKKTDLHKIMRFNRGDEGAWTLIFTGPKAREWGFRTDKGWVSRRDMNLGSED